VRFKGRRVCIWIEGEMGYFSWRTAADTHIDIVLKGSDSRVAFVVVTIWDGIGRKGGRFGEER